jgi:DNA-binding MarR family transcriptional regulator
MTERSARDAEIAWKVMSELVLADDRRERVTRELGISFARVRLLRRLLPTALTLRELADALSADPPYVTLMIDDLEDRGMVERRPHPTDRRAKHVTLTRRGRALAEKAEVLLRSPPQPVADLSARDLKALREIFDRMKR